MEQKRKSSFFKEFPEKIEDNRELHVYQCEKCGKKIKVPFLPDSNKPFYCDNCLAIIGKKENKEEAQLSKKETKDKAIKEEEETNLHKYIKESRGVGPKKILDIIKNLRKKVNSYYPWKIDKYHDEITKKKDNQ